MFSGSMFRALYCAAAIGPLSLSLAGCANPWARGPSAAPLPPATLGSVGGVDCSAKGPIPSECIPRSGMEADAAPLVQ